MFFWRVFIFRNLKGKQNFLKELRLLDQELFNNLQKLKNFNGDLRDLDMNFVIHDDVTDQVTELIPGGHGVVLNNNNVISYLYTYANYKLNETIKRQLTCFIRGFHRILNPKWLKIFSEEELGAIINGNETILDVDDFINNLVLTGIVNTQYVNEWLREIMISWNEATKKKFLKFITSYHNPPLFGFETIDPPIKISKEF
jgi:ubiquitin-protein ligase E3 B